MQTDAEFSEGGGATKLHRTEAYIAPLRETNVTRIYGV